MKYILIKMIIIVLFDDAVAAAAAVMVYATDGENKSNTVTVCGPRRSNKRIGTVHNIVFRDHTEIFKRRTASALAVAV